MALNVGNLVATLSLDKKGFDTGIQDAAKKTRVCGGFSDNSPRSHHARHHGGEGQRATSGIASKLSSLSPTLAAVGDKFKALRPGYLRGSPHSQPHRAAKDKLIGLAQALRRR